jgi:hypothetical protein
MLPAPTRPTPMRRVAEAQENHITNYRTRPLPPRRSQGRSPQPGGQLFDVWISWSVSESGKVFWRGASTREPPLSCGVLRRWLRVDDLVQPLIEFMQRQVCQVFHDAGIKFPGRLS